jgi:hypothetical protein
MSVRDHHMKESRRNDRICKRLNEILTTLTVVAHEAEADDFYRGYFIPKGTRILPLDW